MAGNFIPEEPQAAPIAHIINSNLFLTLNNPNVQGYGNLNLGLHSTIVAPEAFWGPLLNNNPEPALQCVVTYAHPFIQVTNIGQDSLWFAFDNQ